MKTKLFAAMIVVFVLYGVASAQDYGIRVNNNTNLRATYSLEGDRVETVPAGTILQVVGRFNRWLKINRNGNEVWMADWVGFTRVDNGGQEQIQTQEPSPSQSNQIIDNCCYVDRQCHTEHEWTSGYWAFQNNHCSAPARITESGVIIEGSQAFAIQVERALNLLKSRSSEWYAYLNGGLAKIREVPDSQGTGVFTASGIFKLGPDYAFLPGFSSESGIIWLSGVLVHEACHVHRYRAGFAGRTEFEGFREEVVCQQIQIDALEVIDPRNRFKNYLQGLIDDFFSRGYTLPN